MFANEAKFLIIFLRCAFVIWVVILPYSISKPIYEELIKKEIADANDALQKIMDPNTPDDERNKLAIELKVKFETAFKREMQARVRIEELALDNGKLTYEKSNNEKWGLLELIRHKIEDCEEVNFPQTYDDDYELKKVKWDIERLKKTCGFDLREEEHYQRFKYYLENPPNEFMKKLRQRLDKEEVEVSTFSAGIAKAYRLISFQIHNFLKKWIPWFLENFFHHEEVLTAVPILLDEMDISKELIQKIKDIARETRAE